VDLGGNDELGSLPDVTSSAYKKVYEAFRSKQPLHQTIYLLSAEALRRFPLGSPHMSLVETLAQRLNAHVDLHNKVCNPGNLPDKLSTAPEA